jgi:hypothetical protein
MVTVQSETGSSLEIPARQAMDGHAEDGHNEPGPSFNFPGPLYRYHEGGTLVLTVGIISGLALYCWGLSSPLVGFLAGAIPTFLLTALYRTAHDAKC